MSNTYMKKKQNCLLLRDSIDLFFCHLTYPILTSEQQCGTALLE